MTMLGLDSSFARPTPAQAAAAYAAGCRIWGGYLGTRGGLGLATLWTQDDFRVVQDAGMVAVGFCSGWDDPGGIRDLGRAWGVLPCVDVEAGIRVDGPWLDPWLAVSQAGLYGLASVHYESGQPIGRGAAFNVVARYPFAGCSGASWDPAAGPRPAAPCGWQCQGTHDEVGLSVDRGFYDDLAALIGGPVQLDQNDPTAILVSKLAYMLLPPAGQDGAQGEVTQRLRDLSAWLGVEGDLRAAIAKIAAPDPAAFAAALADPLATALTPHLPPGTDPAAVATAVLARLATQLGRP